MSISPYVLPILALQAMDVYIPFSCCPHREMTYFIPAETNEILSICPASIVTAEDMFSASL
jgi:hypothetical protein